MASTEALKNATARANETITKWDESANYVSAAKIRLSESNKAFEKYREAHCNWAVAIGGGAIGNALEIRRLQCVNDLNLARIAQIKAIVKDLPSRISSY